MMCQQQKVHHLIFSAYHLILLSLLSTGTCAFLSPNNYDRLPLPILKGGHRNHRTLRHLQLARKLFATWDDEDDTLPEYNNNRSEEELISIAKEYVANPTPDKLSEDFVFRGPVIGPLCKKDFVATLTSVSSKDKAGLADAFPDLQTNVFGFSVDPTEPNRIWYFERPRGTFLGPFQHPTAGLIEPTGAKYIGPPEARSIILNDNSNKIKYQSVGYVVDRFTGDTTEGRGAVFGLYAVMGQKLDPNVGSPSMIFLQWLSSILPESLGIPKSFSKREDLPEWWKDERMGAEK